MIPSLYGEGARGTIGTDAETAAAFVAMGGEHQNAKVDEIVVDSERKIVSTPAYMLAGSIAEPIVALKSWWPRCWSWPKPCPSYFEPIQEGA